MLLKFNKYYVYVHRFETQKFATHYLECKKSAKKQTPYIIFQKEKEANFPE